jgi:Zn-dependent protease with chaperone function
MSIDPSPLMQIPVMRNTVYQIFSRLGFKNISVNVQPANKPVAWVLGINPGEFLSLPIMGTIFIDNKYLRQNAFAGAEILFILAHESAHIYRNHLITNAAWHILERAIKSADYRYPPVVEAFKGLLALLSPSKLPPNAEALRDNEYAADETAVKLITGDLNSAVSCLRKLCQNNLDLSSHLWEYFDINMPVMTFRERIAELKHRVSQERSYRFV